MKKGFLFLPAFFLFLFSFAQQLIIKDVNIVDVEKGKIISHVNVFIDSNRISKITGGILHPSDRSTIISGTGKYLIPGLWDMHTHNWNSEQFFPLLLANGVTGVRDMFTDWEDVVRWRKEIAEGKYDGPVIYACGPIVDGPQPVWPGSVAVKDAEQGRRAVDSLKNMGADFIKVYTLLPRAAYFAIADECKKQNIPFAGHVPDQVGMIEAAKAGQKSQEHLYGFLVMASDSGEYILKFWKGEIKDSVLADRTAQARCLLRTFNWDRLRKGISELAKYHTWICPTLTVNRSIAHLDDSVFIKDDRLQYMGTFVRSFWNPKNDFRFKDKPADYFNLSRQNFALKAQMIPLLQKAGVPLLAGTDYPNPYCFPGFSLHDELQLMTDAGLSPAQALQTATINPARFFNITRDYGTIATGKIANLVLLDDNPLKNISNTKKIYAVIIRGKLLDRKKLDEMLETVKQKFGN